MPEKSVDCERSLFTLLAVPAYTQPVTLINRSLAFGFIPTDFKAKQGLLVVYRDNRKLFLFQMYFCRASKIKYQLVLKRSSLTWLYRLTSYTKQIWMSHQTVKRQGSWQRKNYSPAVLSACIQQIPLLKDSNKKKTDLHTYLLTNCSQLLVLSLKNFHFAVPIAEMAKNRVCYLFNFSVRCRKLWL